MQTTTRPPAAEAPALEPIERGHAELLEEPAVEHTPGGGTPPPPAEPPRGREFPRFRGGDGDRLPRWQRIAIFGVLLLLSALLGAILGNTARVFARGLEAGRHG